MNHQNAIKIKPQQKYSVYLLTESNGEIGEELAASMGCDIKIIRVNWNKPYALKEVSISEAKVGSYLYAIIGKQNENKWIFEKICFVSISSNYVIFRRQIKGVSTLMMLAPRLHSKSNSPPRLPHLTHNS